MKKELLQKVYDEVELESGSKSQAIETREMIMLGKINDTLKDIETTLARLTSELTEGEG